MMTKARLLWAWLVSVAVGTLLLAWLVNAESLHPALHAGFNQVEAVLVPTLDTLLSGALAALAGWGMALSVEQVAYGVLLVVLVAGFLLLMQLLWWLARVLVVRLAEARAEGRVARFNRRSPGATLHGDRWELWR